MSNFQDTNENYEKLKTKMFDLQFKINSYEKNISELVENISILENESKMISEKIMNKKKELEKEQASNNELKKTFIESNKNLEQIDTAISSLYNMLDIINI